MRLTPLKKRWLSTGTAYAGFANAASAWRTWPNNIWTSIVDLLLARRALWRPNNSPVHGDARIADEGQRRSRCASQGRFRRGRRPAILHTGDRIHPKGVAAHAQA